ncbi:MAG TPA: class I SAM-dependent methyltransferase [Gaiellaceae bacterium]|jgi:tRNA (mo5U34)-methyltransferase|nr:class I SAM-dependent methyltransferase [Gaiellaceae bacterium]
MPSLAEDVARIRWHQMIELPGGVVTSGVFDTVRERENVPLPDALAGMRCLDIGTADGFWAFEMERRGAADVIALDVASRDELDWPGFVDEEEWTVAEHLGGHDGFRLAREAFGSAVRLEKRPVYELSPDEIGVFDFAFMGSLLLHLRDPVGALISIRRVLKPDAQLLSVDTISPLLTALHPRQPIARLEAPGWPLWWIANLAGYRRMFTVAGYAVERTGRPFFLKRGPSYRATARTHRPLYGRFQEAVTRLGILHSWVLARPTST